MNRCGNLIGRMTASFNASFAVCNPATSSHETFGVSDRIAPKRKGLKDRKSDKLYEDRETDSSHSENAANRLYSLESPALSFFVSGSTSSPSSPLKKRWKGRGQGNG